MTWGIAEVIATSTPTNDDGGDDDDNHHHHHVRIITIVNMTNIIMLMVTMMVMVILSRLDKRWNHKSITTRLWSYKHSVVEGALPRERMLLDLMCV